MQEQNNQTIAEEESNNEVEFQPGKKRRWLKVVLWIIGVLILLIVLFFSIPFILSAFWGKDDPMPSDKDLLASVVNISDNENIYSDLRKLNNNLLLIPDDIKIEEYAESLDWEISLTENFLISNQGVLKIFNEAAKKSKFQIAETADPEKIDPYFMPSMGTWRQTARLAAVTSIYLMRQGQEEMAFAQALNIIKIGNKIENSKNQPVTSYLIGNSIYKIGLETMRIILSHSSLSSERLNSYQENISEFKPINNSNFLRLEYTNLKQAILSGGNSSLFGEMIGLAHKLSEFSYYFKPNQTLNLAADYYRRQIKEFEKSCNEDFIDYKFEPDAFWKIYFTENAVGKILVNSSMLLSADVVHERRCEVETLMNLVDTLFALKKYRLQNGSYPQNLQILGTEYPSSSYLDPFTGKLFAFDENKMNIWSSGPNFADNNGGGDDISFSYNFVVTEAKNSTVNEFEFENNLDSDNDGLSDKDEIKYGTDPYNSDTDGDGYSDGEEVFNGYDPLLRL